ncbi:MAG: hypothetical protein AB1490_11990 [Pseudomonadota bacterium]
MKNAASAKHRKLFMAAKVSGGIPLISPLLGDALIQASLDPKISRIELIAVGPTGARPHPLEIVAFHACDGRRLALDLADEESPRDVDVYGLFLVTAEELGLELLQRSRSDIRREPLFANCGMVWSHVNHRVAIGDRIRIMQMLAEEGPLRIGDIIKNGTYRTDPSAALMALACHDVVELDLGEAALGPDTQARIRKRND